MEDFRELFSVFYQAKVGLTQNNSLITLERICKITHEGGIIFFLDYRGNFIAIPSTVNIPCKDRLCLLGKYGVLRRFALPQQTTLRENSRLTHINILELLPLLYGL